jgi:hypothetical protein
VNALDRLPGHGTGHFKVKKKKEKKRVEETEPVDFQLLIHTRSLVITHSACTTTLWPSGLIQAKAAVSSTL